MPALFLRRALVWGMVFFSLDWSAAVWAEPVPDGESVLPQAYQRLDNLRAQEAAQFQAQQAECHSRFAVNGCLRDEQSRHRAALADLKRQETALHEQERAQRGAEQLARIQQKKLEHQNKLDQAAQAGSSAAEKMQKQQDKQAAHAEQAAKAAASNSPAPRPAKPSSPMTAAQQAENRAAYERKRQQAETRRKKAAQRQAEKKPAAALPLPG